MAWVIALRVRDPISRYKRRQVRAGTWKMQSCDIGGSLQSLQGRAGIHNRPTVLTMPPIHLMQNDVLDPDKSLSATHENPVSTLRADNAPPKLQCKTGRPALGSSRPRS